MVFFFLATSSCRFHFLQWELICSKASYPSFAQSAFFVGSLLGSWTFGTLSDTYGRKKIYFLSIAGATLCHFASSVVPLFSMFCLLRLLMGAFVSGLIISGYTLLLEVTDSTRRTFIGIAVHMFSPVGFLVLAASAYYIREWRALMMISSVVGIVFLATWG